MAGWLSDLPSRDHTSFTSVDISRKPTLASFAKERGPARYLATHDRTEPPLDQVIRNEKDSILIREFYKLGLQRAQYSVDADDSEAAKRQAPQSEERPHKRRVRSARTALWQPQL